MSKATVCRISHFNAAHRLHNPNWSAEKNVEVFGLCNRPNYHGHNYVLEVYVTGEINPDTGFVIDTKVLKDMIYNHIEIRFDHRNLNLDCPEFYQLIPTAENIAVVIYDILKKELPLDTELQIKLFETERNIVIYPPLYYR
jgi:6-pyruvoyltetrahydropterin/6-carboxytetrahydropterin synthase